MDSEKSDKQRILAFEIKCYQWTLQISWQQQTVTNVVVTNRVGSTRNLMKMVMELNFFGHIFMRDNRLVEIIMFGRMNGKSVRGRPHRVLADITVQTGVVRYVILVSQSVFTAL